MLLLLSVLALAADPRLEVRTSESVTIQIDGKTVPFAQDGQVAALLVGAGSHTVAIRDASKKPLFEGTVDVPDAGLDCQWARPPGASTLAFFCS